MKLRAISIEQFAGLRHGLELGPEQLSGRVRVLYGPNGIGKSSIVRALRALLWDADAPTSGNVVVEARLEIDGIEWTARRDGSQTNWFRDGSPAPAPKLPTWSQSSQMLVDLDALALGQEGDIQEHLQRELRGGYDMLAVEANLRPGKQVGSVQARDLAVAENGLRSSREAQDAVLRDAERLELLRRDLLAARAAAKRVNGLRAALERAQSASQLAELQAELEAFPDKLELLQGKEVEDLERTQKRLNVARKRIAESRREDERLAGEIAKLGLASPIPSVLLDELGARVDALRDAEMPLSTAEALLAKAEVREARAVASFGPSADIERLAGLDEALDAELETFAREASALAERQSQIQAQIAVLGAIARIAPPEARALTALDDWLGTPVAPTTVGRARTILFVLAGLLLAIAIAMAFEHIAFAALVLPAVVAFYGARSVSTVRGPRRADHEATFSRTAEDPPTAWTAEAVRARLDALHTRSAEAAHAGPRAARRQELEGMFAIAGNDARELAQQRADIAARLGVTAQSPDQLLVAVASARGELRHARRERSEFEAECVRLRAVRATRLAELNDRLRPLGAAEFSDLVAAKLRVGDLRARSGQMISFQKDRDTQIDLARRAQDEVESAEEECAQIYRRAGLEPGDQIGLRSRLARLEDWKTVRARRDGAARDVARLSRDTDPALAAMSAEDLGVALDAARTAASPVDELASAVTRIETRVQVAQEGRTLENALAERDACRAALVDAFAKARTGAFACALLADVRAAHEETSQPKVVKDAAALFTRFTRHRYTLRTDIVDGRLAIKARDAENAGSLQALDQLSDGTRAQLLLAVRIAYLREIEHGNPMPIVLDDALATSDPERMQQIGAALLDVAREEDRQFLVLTKDASDVLVLRPKDALPGEVEATDLAVLRGIREPVVAREALRLPDVPRVPVPGDRSAADYALALDAAGLRVRPIDPYAPIEEVHLWWVLQHDLALLERMLTLRLDSVGRFWNSANAGLAFLGERERSALDPWIALAANVLDAWRVGRGRPIDRDVLERAGVSDTFLERMVNLATLFGGDAKAWVAAVRDGHDLAKRYHTKTLDQNREFLVREGYLDERDVLPREEAWKRVLAAFSTSPGTDDHALRERFELLWNACGP